MVSGSTTPWAFAPGLLLIGLGLGAMLTPVNIVQSSFPDAQQGEISGLSRSVSNLGSCLGTAVAGTILVAGITATPGRAYALAMTVVAAVGLVGFVMALLLPAAAVRRLRSSSGRTAIRSATEKLIKIGRRDRIG